MNRRIYKSIFLVCLILLTVSALSFIRVSADAVPSIEGSVFTFADVGRTYTYECKLTNPSFSGVNGLALELTWDPDALSYAGDAETANVFPADARVMFGTSAASEGRLRFAVASISEILSPSDEAATIFTAGFTLLETSKDSVPFSIRLLNFGNAEHEYADSFEISAGYIEKDSSEKRIVYVADGGYGDGSSPDSPLGHAEDFDPDNLTSDSYKRTAFYLALDLVKNEKAVIVVVGPTSITGLNLASGATGNWHSPTGSDDACVTITSFYDGVDYRDSGAALIYDLSLYNPRIHFHMNSVWDHLEFRVDYASQTISGTTWKPSPAATPAIAFYGYETYIGSDFQTKRFIRSIGDYENAEDGNSGHTSYYPIFAGGMMWGTSLNRDYTIEVNGGTWSNVYATNNFGTATVESLYVGHARLIMGGNIVVYGTTYATSTSNGSYTENGTTKYYYNCLASGEIDIIINGGSFHLIMFGRNAFADNDSILRVKVNGGTFASNYARVFWASGGSNFPSPVYKGTRILDFSGMAKSDFDAMTCKTSAGVVPVTSCYYDTATNATHGYEQIILPEDKTLSSISVTSVGKNVYHPGEFFESREYAFSMEYADGSSAILESGRLSFDKTLPLTPEDTAVTFTFAYGGNDYTVSQPIFVGYALAGLEVLSAGKTVYSAGETFDASGFTFTATYRDGSTAEIPGASIDVPTKALRTVDSSVTVSYTEGIVTKYCDIPVTVSGSLSSIAVTASGKTNYFVGETFSVDDFVVTATFGDGSKMTVDKKLLSVSPAGALAVSDKSVTLSYTFDGITRTADVPISVTLGVNSLAVLTYGRQNYEVHEAFSFDGFSFSATYSDLTAGKVDSADLTVDTSVLDLAAGTKTVRVTYTYGLSSVYAEIPINVYTLTSYRTGDVNMDGDINILDITMTMNHVLNGEEMVAENLEQADFDGNDAVDVFDVAELIRKCAGDTFLLLCDADSVSEMNGATFPVRVKGGKIASQITASTLDGAPFSGTNVEPGSVFLASYSSFSDSCDLLTPESYTASGEVSLTFAPGESTCAVSGTLPGFDASEIVFNSKTRIFVYDATASVYVTAVGIAASSFADVSGGPTITIRDGARVVFADNCLIVGNGALSGVFSAD